MQSFKTSGVCARTINFELKDGVIEHLDFEGGCEGNLKAISKLVTGQNADEIADLLAGNTCGQRPTSCADQLSRALREALAG